MVTPMFLKGNILAAPEPGSGGPTRSIFNGFSGLVFLAENLLEVGWAGGPCETETTGPAGSVGRPGQGS
jgi:hypothetical protein